MMEVQLVLELSMLIGLLALIRVLYLIHKITTGFARKSPVGRSSPCSVLICVGSGGHTTEILKLFEKVDFVKMVPRFYIMAATDKMSYNRVVDLEQSKGGKSKLYSIIKIPRSREVHQLYLTSVFTTLYSMLYCLPILLKTMPDLIICNGPGTCIPICVVGFMLKCMFIKDIRIVYIESYCRVETFSLTGKILAYLADNFLVQWPKLQTKMRRAEYIGQLI